MSVVAGVSCAALATREKLRGGIDKAEVRRYWPGKAPVWAKKAEEDNDLNGLGKVISKHGDLIVARKDDPRLRRCAQTRVEKREYVRADHRRVKEAEIISTGEEELRNQESIKDEREEEDEDAIEERRRIIREKSRLRAQEEVELLPKEEEVQDEEEEVEEEESESEYETDSDTSLKGRLKPVFVPKAKRDTVAERERLEAEEEALEELAKKRLEMRKIETKQIVVEEIRKDEVIRQNKLLQEADIGDVDTDDEMDEAAEYERWKAREFARIKREKDEREAMSRESEEVDKLRKMTEKERKVWERENPETCRKAASTKLKTKQKFMQRYYHKGAFYQEDGILKRDYSAPTGEDRLDKTKLPEVLKVRKFGHSGRTKWTHLVKEDTTNRVPWTSVVDPRLEEYKKMMSG